MSDSHFEIREHTADFVIAGRAKDLPGLFAVMAQGLFRLLADGDPPRHTSERTVRLDAESIPDLMHAWLEELNGLHHIHHELYGAFRVGIDGTSLRATIGGETIGERHGMQHEVKGITWHELEVEETGDGWEASVLVDV